MSEQYLYKETPTGMYWLVPRLKEKTWMGSNFESIEMIFDATNPRNSAILISSSQELAVQISLGLIPEWVIDYYDPTEEDCSYYLLTVAEA